MNEEAVPQSVAPQPVKRPRGRPRKVKPELGEALAVKTTIKKRARKAAPKERIAPPAVAAPAQVTPIKYILAIGRRKRAVARVFMYHNGHGEIEVNGKLADAYFTLATLRDIVRSPLEHSSFKTTVRIVAKVRGGGIRGQAEAIQLGIARALVQLDETLRTAMRTRGYLTRDPREKERKKPGLKRARRAPQWQKR